MLLLISIFLTIFLSIYRCIYIKVLKKCGDILIIDEDDNEENYENEENVHIDDIEENEDKNKLDQGHLGMSDPLKLDF